MPICFCPQPRDRSSKYQTFSGYTSWRHHRSKTYYQNESGYQHKVFSEVSLYFDRYDDHTSGSNALGSTKATDSPRSLNQTDLTRHEQATEFPSDRPEGISGVCYASWRALDSTTLTLDRQAAIDSALCYNHGFDAVMTGWVIG